MPTLNEDRIETSADRSDSIHAWCIEMMEAGANAGELVTVLKEMISVLEAEFV